MWFAMKFDALARAAPQLKLPSVTDGDYMTAFNHLVMPIAYELRPDIIIVSAGFDAADRDPVGELGCTAQCSADFCSQA